MHKADNSFARLSRYTDTMKDEDMIVAFAKPLLEVGHRSKLTIRSSSYVHPLSCLWMANPAIAAVGRAITMDISIRTQSQKKCYSILSLNNLILLSRESNCYNERGNHYHDGYQEGGNY